MRISDWSSDVCSSDLAPFFRIAVLFIFIGTAYQFVLKRSWEKWRMARIQAKLTDHIVVLGFGISGSEAVRELIARGTEPAQIVVIDQARGRINARSEEHTSELQSLMRISYAVFCLQKKTI